MSLSDISSFTVEGHLRKQGSSLSEDRRSQLGAFQMKEQFSGQGKYFIERSVVEQNLKKFPVTVEPKLY